ncbi:MAG: RidA family protein [Bacteroidetes bacterium]|nr:RidA family protein [Bacteroidota bacterium]MCH8232585.1 RidA family protein [Bacteroidota bacterium]
MNKSVVNTGNAPAPIGPYNQAILAGDTLYVSGQIPIDPVGGEIVQDTIEEETRLVMTNMGNILKEAGMDYSHVVKCSIFINDMNNFGSVNEVYGTFFQEQAPARETVEVSRLPKDVRVEISCIAVK